VGILVLCSGEKFQSVKDGNLSLRNSRVGLRQHGSRRSEGSLGLMDAQEIVIRGRK